MHQLGFHHEVSWGNVNAPARASGRFEDDTTWKSFSDKLKGFSGVLWFSLPDVGFGSALMTKAHTIYFNEAR